MPEPTALIQDDHQADGWLAVGDWRIEQVAELLADRGRWPQSGRRIDASTLNSMDSAGALALVRISTHLGLGPDDLILGEQHRRLFGLVAKTDRAPPDGGLRAFGWRPALAGLGRQLESAGVNVHQALGFLGLTLSTWASTLLRPRTWRVTSLVHHMHQTGLNALGLVVLLSFLVGAVVAFLGATVLRDFGAELFVIDLTVYAFLREFGVLLTAIILAGRTASAFTAQIGTMKSREEIDAIRTLGLDPMVLLVLPRLLALLLVLPILTVCAMLAGLLGGLSVSMLSLDIPAELFARRAQDSVELRHYLVGLIKAPLFAIVIALVGCREGFKVAGTAQSVGERTTSAVVQSISLVIVIDAVAAIVFMELGW